MDASFWAIYRRGRFSFGDKTEEERMQQRERFGAACLAFCLRHDDTFCASFIREICKCKASLEPWSIQVDPYPWADLLLQTRDTAIVVECKVADSLMDKQNPWRAEATFTAPLRGYGDQFRNEFAKAHRLYIALTETLSEPHKSVVGIDCRTATWNDLTKVKVSNRRMQIDLFTTLANLEYPSFHMKKAKEVHFSDLASVLGAHAILKAVAKKLRISSSSVRADCGFGEGESGEIVDGNFGINIPGGLPGSAAIDPKRDAGWFGYELTRLPDGRSRSDLSVYFYCGTDTAKQIIAERADGRGWKKVSGNDFKNSAEHYLRYIRPLVERESPFEHFIQFLGPVLKPG